MFSSLVIGLIVGAGYGLMAVGIVLIYKASRHLNFAQGEFGTVATFVAWLTLERDLGWPLAAVLAVLTGIVMGVVVERLIVRPLSSYPPVIVLVATAGVAFLAIGVQIIVGEARLRALSEPWAASLSIAGVNVRGQHALILLALLVFGGALFVFFRSAIGTALLATSQEPFAARIVGIDTKRMSTLTWGLAGALGGAAGILFAPLGAFTPGFMTSDRLIAGFVAAVLGGMTSMPGAIVGGLVVGVVEAFSGHFLSQSIAGADLLGVFVALLVVLFVRPQGLLGKDA